MEAGWKFDTGLVESHRGMRNRSKGFENSLLGRGIRKTGFADGLHGHGIRNTGFTDGLYGMTGTEKHCL